MIVSNEQDFFADFESSSDRAALPRKALSFGNEWELYVASLSETSARVKRAVEKLRAAEALAAIESQFDPAFAAAREAERDQGCLDFGLYFEHNFGMVGAPTGAAGVSARLQWQERLADEIEAYVDGLHADGVAALTGWMWIHLYPYPFQIYFAFTRYTDIAIGIARLVRIKLPENFLAPYTKPNLTQFWNSWHITLTQWIRSYFFNPFNRWIRGYKSIPAWTMILIGQLSTMLLIGLWHGITWNFILWGAWHGLGLFLQNRWSDFAKTRINTTNPRWQTALQLSGVLLTFHFVALGWVFFALSEPSLSGMVFRKLFGL